MDVIIFVINSAHAVVEALQRVTQNEKEAKALSLRIVAIADLVDQLRQVYARKDKQHGATSSDAAVAPAALMALRTTMMQFQDWVSVYCGAQKTNSVMRKVVENTMKTFNAKNDKEIFAAFDNALSNHMEALSLMGITSVEVKVENMSTEMRSMWDMLRIEQQAFLQQVQRNHAQVMMMMTTTSSSSSSSGAGAGAGGSSAVTDAIQWNLSTALTRLEGIHALLVEQTHAKLDHANANHDHTHAKLDTLRGNAEDQTKLLRRLLQLMEGRAGFGLGGVSHAGSGPGDVHSRDAGGSNASNTIKRFPWSELKLSPGCSTPKELGTGAFGVVKEYELDHRLVAVKELKGTAFTNRGEDGRVISSGAGNEYTSIDEDPSLLDRTERESLLHEASILASLDHDHVVHIFGIADDVLTGRLGLVMRHMSHSLDNTSVLRALPIHLRLSYVLQIARGLAYLHGRPMPVVHGDVKPGNVLVSKGKEEVALSDFGFSRVKQSQLHRAMMTGGGVSSYGGPRQIGTDMFCAPELFEVDDEENPVRGANRASDVFGFGITAYCILCGVSTPYPIKDPKTGAFIKPRVYVRKGSRPDLDKLPMLEGVDGVNQTETIKDILQKCWSKDPGDRLSMPVVVKHLQGVVEKMGMQGGAHGTSVGGAAPVRADEETKMENRSPPHANDSEPKSPGETRSELTASELKASGHSASQLKVAGYSATSLRRVGYTLSELKAAGYSTSELKAAFYTLAQLKTAGSTAVELRASGSTASELKAAGFPLPKLKEGGYSPSELRAADYTAFELHEAGYTASELHEAGYTASELRSAYFKAFELRDAGFTASDLRSAGYSLSELKLAGYTTSQLKEAGCTASDLKEVGFNALQLKVANYTASQLKRAGYSASDLEQAGYTGSEVKEAGWTWPEVGRAGFYTAAELKAAGHSAIALKEAGFTVLELKEAGFTVLELKAAGYISSELKAAGFNASALKEAGYTTATAELKAAGHSAIALKEAGFTVLELKEAGFTVLELKAAGYISSEIKAAGFNAFELKKAGYTTVHLKRAGYTASQLKDTGYTVSQLIEAGYTLVDFKHLFGFQEYIKAGYSAAELSAEGILRK